MKRAAIYLRVSTKEQTTDNQRLELERAAQAKGWRIEVAYEDTGISGTKGRDKRPSFDQMLRDATRAKFDIVMAWDVSRLSRSLSGLVLALDELNANRIGLYLHQQAIDTSTPAGMALFQMCGVFAQFERSIISERVKAGLSRAAANGKSLGRPKLTVDRVAMQNDLKSGMPMRKVASKYGTSIGYVHGLSTRPN